MRSIDELLEEAKWGKLTQEELEYVVNKIKDYKEDDAEDLYTLLYTLGRSGAIEYRKLVEKFLYYPNDPMVSSMALKTLCDYWSLDEEYLREIKAFARGVEWDFDGDVRTIAISTAGEYLRRNPEKELLEILFKILEDENENKIDQESVFQALARATGRNYNEFLIVKDQRPPDPSIMQKVLKDAHAMLEKLQEKNKFERDI